MSFPSFSKRDFGESGASQMDPHGAMLQRDLWRRTSLSKHINFLVMAFWAPRHSPSFTQLAVCTTLLSPVNHVCNSKGRISSQ